MGGGAIADRTREAERRREVDHVRRDLNKLAATLAPKLLPNGRKEGQYWATSNIRDDKSGSFSLKVDLRKGTWADYGKPRGSAGASGDMLSLLIERECDGNFAEGMKRARELLGMGDMSAADLAKSRAASERQAAIADKEAEAERERKRGQAWYLVRGEGAAMIAGTPAQAYLERRGISFAMLGKFPSSLRYRADVWCTEAKEAWGYSMAKLPAMVAGVLALDGTLLGAHRTYLDLSNGRGGPVFNVKESGLLKVAKLSLGSSIGGHIPIQKGLSRASLKDIPEGTDIYVAEGIENALSVAMAKPDARVIASVSGSKLHALQLPPQMGDLVIIADNDPPGSDGAETLEKAIAAHQAKGRRVRPMFPHPPHFKDFNDMLMGKVRK